VPYPPRPQNPGSDGRTPGLPSVPWPPRVEGHGDNPTPGAPPQARLSPTLPAAMRARNTPAPPPLTVVAEPLDADPWEPPPPRHLAHSTGPVAPRSDRPATLAAATSPRHLAPETEPAAAPPDRSPTATPTAAPPDQSPMWPRPTATPQPLTATPARPTVSQAAPVTTPATGSPSLRDALSRHWPHRRPTRTESPDEESTLRLPRLRDSTGSPVGTPRPTGPQPGASSREGRPPLATGSAALSPQADPAADQTDHPSTRTAWALPGAATSVAPPSEAQPPRAPWAEFGSHEPPPRPSKGWNAPPASPGRARPDWPELTVRRRADDRADDDGEALWRALSRPSLTLADRAPADGSTAGAGGAVSAATGPTAAPVTPQLEEAAG